MSDTLNIKNKTIGKVRADFKKALNKYRLIEDNDHILIGLSGGKDSLALLQLIGERMKIFSPRFTATAVHISVENIGYSSDLFYLKSLCDNYNIPFIHRTISYIEKPEYKKPVCFLCSWHRRKALFETAKELKCNKIALGHHLDDTVETILMNLIYQGSFAGMPPDLKFSKFDMTLIRPLCMIAEKDIIEMEKIMNYKKQIKNCPFEKESARTQIKQLVGQLENLNPMVRHSIHKATENIKKDYLPYFSE